MNLSWREAARDDLSPFVARTAPDLEAVCFRLEY
jgi:hypothetical protein